MKKLLAAAAALVIAVAAGFAPASARASYVIDNANLFSPATVSLINAKVGDFNVQAHKEVVVITEPSFTGTAADAEERAFAQQQVNGVLIYIAKSPKTIAVIPDRVSGHIFPPGATAAIRQAIVSAFNSGDFNGGINNGVDLTLTEYRSHLGSVRSTVNTEPASAPMVRNETGGGFNMSLIWWLIALAVIFFVVRGIFRAIAGPRMYPPGYGGGGPMGGPGYGGYGPGYGGGGFGGGGGGFWSGMLGGLGGAFLGNELFGGGRNEMFNNPGQQAGFGGDGGQYGGGDSSGFQNDAGQADMGNASSGGWGGDSGGGGGGWGGDSGGGGGDFGGGGGDGGGGW